MRELFITLGHNSSAVLAIDGKVVAGYEQERLDRVKSSSAYPAQAIDRMLGVHGNVDKAYVSHWFDDFRLFDSKYLDTGHLRGLAMSVESVSPEFTHHDAHCQSAISFYKSNAALPMGEANVLVVDGFGNRQECVSLYRISHLDGTPQLMHRIYGYEMSLGLMYQYATEYLGMKPNQDEYKLLGYEAHVLEHVDLSQVHRLLDAVDADARIHVDMMMSSGRKQYHGGTFPIDLGALRGAKVRWWQMYQGWRDIVATPLSEVGTRCVVALCAQRFIERCVVALATDLVRIPRWALDAPLILAGGCFLNVKLSRKVALATGRRCFPHPLSGDQGAALGFVPATVQGGLLWGHRRIGDLPPESLPKGCNYVDQGEWVGAAHRALEHGRIVNVVRGAMEYGPRALCNTSTLAWSHRLNVSAINKLNDRDESMPMAPVISAESAKGVFRKSEMGILHPGEKFMVTTIAFEGEPHDNLKGVAHSDPLDPQLWTARPQVVREGEDMHALLDSLDATCLINTSFNYHGEPIVCSEHEAVETHLKQCLNAQRLDLSAPVTLLVRSDK